MISMSASSAWRSGASRRRPARGVSCFISNYSWLDGLAFTGMRERYLEAFDAIRIACLNGDEYKTGEVAPDGSPDPSIFSTESDPVGIQVGPHGPAAQGALPTRWLGDGPDPAPASPAGRRGPAQESA